MHSLALLVSVILLGILVASLLSLYAAMRKKSPSGLSTRLVLYASCLVSISGGVLLIWSLDAAVMRLFGVIAVTTGCLGFAKQLRNKPQG